MHTPDPFWEAILQDLAYGRAPYGCSVDDQEIVCHVSGQLFQYIYTTHTPADACYELIELFQKHLEMRSMRDHRISASEARDHAQQYIYQPWNDIRKRSIKNFLIEEYILDMKRMYTWNTVQASNVLSLIMLGFHFKLLTAKDIDYDSIQGRILHIHKVAVTPNGIRLDAPIVPSTNDEMID